MGVWKRYESKRVSFTKFLFVHVLPNVNSEKNFKDDMNVEGTNLQRHFQRCTSHFLEHYASRRNSSWFNVDASRMAQVRIGSSVKFYFRSTLVRVFSAHAKLTRPSEDKEFGIDSSRTTTLRIRIEFEYKSDILESTVELCIMLTSWNKELHIKARAMFLWMWRLPMPSHHWILNSFELRNNWKYPTFLSISAILSYV